MEVEEPDVDELEEVAGAEEVDEVEEGIGIVVVDEDCAALPFSKEPVPFPADADSSSPRPGASGLARDGSAPAAARVGEEEFAEGCAAGADGLASVMGCGSGKY